MKKIMRVGTDFVGVGLGVDHALVSMIDSSPPSQNDIPALPASSMKTYKNTTVCMSNSCLRGIYLCPIKILK